MVLAQRGKHQHQHTLTERNKEIYCLGADHKVRWLPKRKTTVRGYCCGLLHTARAFSIRCLTSFSSLSPLFNITFGPKVQILIENENVCLVTCELILCAEKKGESPGKTQRGKIVALRHILEKIILRGPEKTCRWLQSFIPQRFSMLSRRLSVRTAGLDVIEGKEGGVLHFGPNKLHFCSPKMKYSQIHVQRVKKY